MAESKPAIVIYCWHPKFSYPFEVDWAYQLLETRSADVADKIRLDPYMRSLFTEKELNIIERDPLSLIAYKRRLLVPSIELKLSELGLINSPLRLPKYDFKNNWHPGNGTKIYNVTNNNSERKINPINKQTLQGTPKPTNRTFNGDEKAFIYICKYLKERGVNVIIIIMPWNPQYSGLGHPSDERRQYFRDFF